MATACLSAMVKDLMQSKSLFQEKLDGNDMVQLITRRFQRFAPEELLSLDDRELSRRISSVMTIEATAGLLNDLTPEEMERFDEAVEGR